MRTPFSLYSQNPYYWSTAKLRSTWRRLSHAKKARKDSTPMTSRQLQRHLRQWLTPYWMRGNHQSPDRNNGCNAYHYPPIQRKRITEEAKSMLKAGIIRESESPWASPVVVIKKKGEHGGSALTSENSTTLPRNVTGPCPELTMC